jgi:hypothetical protein
LSEEVSDESKSASTFSIGLAGFVTIGSFSFPLVISPLVDLPVSSVFALISICWMPPAKESFFRPKQVFFNTFNL